MFDQESRRKLDQSLECSNKQLQAQELPTFGICIMEVFGHKLFHNLARNEKCYAHISFLILNVYNVNVKPETAVFHPFLILHLQT